MYSVDDIIENLDRESNVDGNNLGDDVELIEEGDLEPSEDVPAEGDENSNENETTKPAKKTRAKSDRPKLDAIRLRGPRGLTALDKMFSNMKYKGHGHEKEDLDKVMVTLHHWCHRLFPKYTFDDTLKHLEKLGTKRSVITLKNSVRMGLMDEQENQNNEEVIDEPEDMMNEFDALLEQEVNIVQRAPSPERDTLTEEQKEMIAKNRLLAAERRRARLEKQNESSQNSEILINASQEIENIIQNESQNTDLSKNLSQNLENHVNTIQNESNQYSEMSSSQVKNNSDNLQSENNFSEIEAQSMEMNEQLICEE